jgi:hypothetical protein
MVTKRKTGIVAKSKGNTYVKRVKGKGRGVFAKRDIEEGQVIEMCPVLVFSKGEGRHLKKTNMHNYHFDWKKGGSALLLGFGSLYNHDDDPNAEMLHDMTKRVSDVIALRDIDAHEEITIDYTGGDPEVEVWFDQE